jgi:hypothetical protein
MENKQTAVDWLVNEIKFARNLCNDPSAEMDIWHTLDVLIAKGDKAKEMEKEQILHSYADGQADTLLMFKQKISKMKDIPSEFNQLISENFWDLV